MLEPSEICLTASCLKVAAYREIKADWVNNFLRPFFSTKQGALNKKKHKESLYFLVSEKHTLEIFKQTM